MQKFNSPLILKIAVILFLSAISAILLSVSFAAEKVYIRAAIIQDAEAVALRIYGSYELLDLSENKLLLRAKNLKTNVTLGAAGINLGDRQYRARKLFIKIEEEAGAVVNGRRFRGNLILIRKDNQRILLVNSIELEDYLKGILYHEVSHYWPMEALKAQAVASRTYALYHAKQNARRDYDLTSDIYSQVYGGMYSERYRTSRAVEQTKGEALEYSGSVFPSYFHATCAGHTEDASLLWNINIEALKGVSCNFCMNSPHFRWHYIVPTDELRQKLAAKGYDISDIEKIEISGKTPSGRIKEMSIFSSRTNLKIPAKDFRIIIGPNLLRSTDFTVYTAEKEAVFEGKGWGHGVGMCQWGAYFMARQGYNYKEILGRYYSGCKIKKISGY